MHLTDLDDFVVSYYSLDEIRNLCFELAIEFENLEGRTRNTKARSLVLYMGRQRRFDELYAALRASRPNLFAKSEFDTSPEGLEANYSELDEFAAQTRPLAEKMLGRVGLEQRAGFIALILLLLISSVLLFVGLREVGPGRMTGDFNIAVAPFQVLGDADPETGEDVANSIYGRLLESFEDLTSPIVHVWGPANPRLNPIQVVKGDSAEARAKEAAALGEEIDADIVVYGVVDATGQNWQVIPEFYISSQNFKDAAEMLGQHNFGSNFIVPGKDKRALRISASDKLSPRAEILSQLAFGLIFYSITDYDRALDYFTSIENHDQFTEDNGAEVVYLLIGNTLSKKAQILTQENAQESDEAINQYVRQLFLEAGGYYDRSLDIDPEYARAYIGNGNVAYHLGLGDGKNVDLELLNESIILCEKALEAGNKPNLSDIETKVHSCLGHSYFLLLRLGKSVPVETVINEFEAIISEYDDGTNPRVREMAAEAHARLGLLYDTVLDNKSKAKTEYEVAVELLFDNPARQEFFQHRVNELEARLIESS